MSKLKLNIAALVLATLFISGSSLSGAQKLSAKGYEVRSKDTRIELAFPDGSVLTVPRDFGGKSVDKLTATGGMAGELLDEAYRQLGLEKSASLPKAFCLSQNRPNPFNPSTTIYYSIPDGLAQVPVKLIIYNLRGQLVRILVEDTQQPGNYSVNWDGMDINGSKVSNGVYFYRLNAGDFICTRKMVLLK